MMLKKMKAQAGAEKAADVKGGANSVFDSSHDIWLAGLGAFSRAQAEGMKMFDALVKQGAHLEQKTKQAAADTAAAARGAAKAKAKEVQEMAGGTWDKLEQVFEDRVARALSKLGVYTQNDVQRLAARVDELSDAVNRLLNATGAPARKPARAAAKAAGTAPAKAAGKAPAKTPAKSVRKSARPKAAGK